MGRPYTQHSTEPSEGVVLGSLPVFWNRDGLFNSEYLYFLRV